MFDASMGPVIPENLEKYLPFAEDTLYRRSTEADLFCRLTDLTELSLTDGMLSNPVRSQLQCPSNLHELSLSNLGIKEAWISSVFSLTPQLTSLKLEGCYTDGDYSNVVGSLKPISTLR